MVDLLGHKVSMIGLANLHAQYMTIKCEIDAAIAGVIASSAYINGPEVADFEHEFAAYTGARNCVGVANGTDALEIAIAGLRLHGFEILMPAMTAAPTVEAVIRTSNKPVFCDIGPDYTLDPDEIERRITNDTVAIIVVHLYGAPANMPAILEVARKYDLYVIEDCAQAHGTRIDGTHVGNFGIVGAFSFFPGKNIGAYGDAGALITNNPMLAKRCRALANHGRHTKYGHELVGCNSRLDALQAAVLRVKLRHYPEWLERRQAHAAVYDAHFAGRVQLPQWDNPDHTYSYHQYPLRVPQRDQVKVALKQLGVGAGIHYPFALPKLPCYAWHADGSYPQAEALANEELSLPVHEMLSETDLEQVMTAVDTVLDHARK
jgi:dTDP-4-amino-4,6-dideoxygalactose transaminase